MTSFYLNLRFSTRKLKLAARFLVKVSHNSFKIFYFVLKALRIFNIVRRSFPVTFGCYWSVWVFSFVLFVLECNVVVYRFQLTDFLKIFWFDAITIETGFWALLFWKLQCDWIFCTFRIALLAVLWPDFAFKRLFYAHTILRGILKEFFQYPANLLVFFNFLFLKKDAAILWSLCLEFDLILF